MAYVDGSRPSHKSAPTWQAMPVKKGAQSLDIESQHTGCSRSQLRDPGNEAAPPEEIMNRFITRVALHSARWPAERARLYRYLAASEFRGRCWAPVTRWTATAGSLPC